MSCKGLLSVLVLACAATLSFAQYEYDYGEQYGEKDEAYYDSYGYYGDEDEAYYEYYGYYADDFAGYEDYYAEEYDYYEDCVLDSNNKPVLSNSTSAAACDIKVTGVDKQADKLAGGIDGIYSLASCYNGKPMYKRKPLKKFPGEDRVLWYSSTFGDWDISKGTDPNEAEILMYGGEMEHATVPLFVSSWQLGGDLKTDAAGGEDDYLPVNVKMMCADGTTFSENDDVVKYSNKVGPALTDAEIEAKYRYIYDKYKSADPTPTISFTFVVLLVMTGLTIVLAIPYFLLKKKGNGKSPIASSFAQMLQQSKKRHSGHTN